MKLTLVEVINYIGIILFFGGIFRMNSEVDRGAGSVVFGISLLILLGLIFYNNYTKK